MRQGSLARMHGGATHIANVCIRVLALMLLIGPLQSTVSAQVSIPRKRDANAGLPDLSPSDTTGRAVRALLAPIIDGRDDDAVWRTAPPMTEFRQFDPGEDQPTAFRTEVRAAYDDRYLYVLVRAFDPHPDSIVSLLSRRDVKTASDQLKIVIDAYHDRRTGVEMAINPAGVKRDYAIYSDNVEDQTWDGVWDASARIDSLGWIAEFRVPFSQLRFGTADTHAFGFAVWRDIARRNQRDAWPRYRMSKRTFMSQLGTLYGIEHIGAARRLELLPYVVAKSTPIITGVARGAGSSLTGGLDLKAGLGSNVTVDATINPDFGQVEADPAVLNLSAFEIQFAEQRPFFQEGAGLYRCNGPCEGVFYTRRIGRTPQLRTDASDPAFTHINGAAKVTGRFGNGVAFGVIDALTEKVQGARGTTIEPSTNYFVARALRELRGGRTEFGLELTDVRRQLDNVTAPLLRRSATSLLLQGYTRFANDKWEWMGYTTLNGVQGTAHAIALTQQGSVHYFQRPDHNATYDSTRTSLRGLAAATGIKQVGGQVRYENFLRYASAGLELNDLGFSQLVNDMSLRQQLDLTQIKPHGWLRSAFSTSSLESHWTTGGLLATQTLSLYNNATLTNNWGAALAAGVSDFGGTHCVSCARGGPALRQSPKFGLRLDLSGDPRPDVVPHVALRTGRSDEGRSFYRGGDLGVDVRVASRFSTSLGGSYDHVVNDQQWIGNYGALRSDTTHYTFANLDQHIFALIGRANWTATRTLSLQFYAQPFISAGSFRQWRQVAAARASLYEARFRSYGNGAVPGGFNVKQFNSNAVLRWEYRPASTLFLVWQQGRAQGDRDPGDFDATRDVGTLFGSRPLNTVLIKYSYWFNP